MSVNISITVETSEGIKITKQVKDQGGDNPTCNAQNFVDYVYPLLTEIHRLLSVINPPISTREKIELARSAWKPSHE